VQREYRIKVGKTTRQQAVKLTPEELVERAAQRVRDFDARQEKRRQRKLLNEERSAATAEKKKQRREESLQHIDALRRERQAKMEAREDVHLEWKRLWEAGAEERKRRAREARNLSVQRTNHGRRKAVLDGYGNVCACCGETEPKLLSLDHIRGGGKKDRAKRNNQQIYKDIIKRGFPKDEFQLLCYNCNMAKGIYGICPHRLAFFQRDYIPSAPRRRNVA
jgi:hypothetical protein